MAAAKKKTSKAAPKKKPPEKRTKKTAKRAPSGALGPIQMATLYSKRDGSLKHWLVKSEPDVFSIDDLRRDGVTTWEGVRNYTARNFMRDGMSLGDLVLYYHSNAEPSGIVGVAKVVALAEPDPTQFDPKSEYFDPGSTRAEPRWLMVRVGFVEKFPTLLTLDALKKDKSLAAMLVLQKGQRLSVQPVSPAHFEKVLSLGRSQ